MAMTIPTTAEELETLLTDRKQMAKVVADGNLKEVISNYANVRMSKDSGILKQVQDETQRTTLQWLRDHGTAKGNSPIPLNYNPITGGSGKYRINQSAKGAAYNPKAPGAKVEELYDNSADFLQSAWWNYATLANANELSAKRDKATAIRNSFGSVVPADGGFLIPETLRSELLSVALETAVVRPRATVIPMESLRVPIPIIDSTSNVSSVFGGVTAYWTEEGGALTESVATFGRVVLDAKKLTAYAVIPNELLQDASAFGGFFEQRFPQAISFFEDSAFMTGLGNQTPLGYVSCPASVSVTAETGQTTGTIVWENIVKMYSRMLPTSLGNAVWIASIDTFPQLATMALSVGTGGSAVWLGNFQNSGAATPPMSILGRPVIFTEKTPALGTTGDISFVDLSYYLIGDRQSMQVASSTEFKFGNDQTAFRVIERVDGRPWIQSAITPKNNSANTLSPFVQLATR